MFNVYCYSLQVTHDINVLLDKFAECSNIMTSYHNVRFKYYTRRLKIQIIIIYSFWNNNFN